MKTFDHLQYGEQTCPTAYRVEQMMNDCGSPQSHLERLEKEMTTPDLWRFMLGCILYWNETKLWDDRNKYGVFSSRQIIGHFPELKKVKIPDDTLKECFCFTRYAHRYLQNEFFKTIQEFLKKDGTMGIQSWFDSQQFVYADTDDSLIPYEDYRLAKLGIS